MARQKKSLKKQTKWAVGKKCKWNNTVCEAVWCT